MPAPSEIQLKITIDNSGAVASVINLGKNVEITENKVNQLSDTMHTAFIKGGLAFDGLKTMYQTLSGMFGGLLNEYKTQEQANAKVESVIRATGGAAGFTADEVKKLSEELALNSQYTDDAILDAEGLLLTFKAIGKDVFPQATQAALDLSATFNQDLKSSAIQLGKALQDPVEGVTALRRVGVSFSDEQLEVIKRLVETNKLVEAQTLILREVESQVKGTDKAMAEANGVVKFDKAISELKETAGGVVSDVITPVVSGIATLTDFMNANYPTLTKFATGVGLITASFIVLHTTGTTTAITGMVSFLRTITIATIANEGFLISIGKTTIALTMMQLALGGVVAAVAILAGVLYTVYRQSEQLEQQHREQFVASTKKMVDDSVTELQRLDKANQKKVIEWEISDAQEQIKILEATLYRLQQTPGTSPGQIQQVRELLQIEQQRLTTFQHLAAEQEKAAKNAQASIEVQLQIEKAKADAMQEGTAKRTALINYEFRQTKAELDKQLQERKISEAQHTQLVELARQERTNKLVALAEQNAQKERAIALQSLTFRVNLEKDVVLASITNAENVALAHARSEEEKSKITKQFALARVQAELDATLKILDAEQDAANKIKNPEERSKTLTEISEKRTSALTTAQIKTESINTEYNLAISKNTLANANTVAEINRDINATEQQRLDDAFIRNAYYFELDNELIQSKRKLATLIKQLGETTDTNEQKRLQDEIQRSREKINAIESEKKAREEATKSMIVSAAAQYEAERSVGENIVSSVKKTIIAKIAESVATYIASVVASTGPLAFIIAPAAGIAMQAALSAFLPRFAQGRIGVTPDGVVTGPGGPTDDNILALISSGESIINAQRTAEYPKTLRMINDGIFPKTFESINILRLAEGYVPAISDNVRISILGTRHETAGSSGTVIDDLKKEFSSLRKAIANIKNEIVIQSNFDIQQYHRADKKLQRTRAAFAL
ncbi:MAG: phage tail length tape measure family protein [Bacteroidota bacterium]